MHRLFSYLRSALHPFIGFPKIRSASLTENKCDDVHSVESPPFDLSEVPDEKFLALLKAIEECPETAEEMEKKSIQEDGEPDTLNYPPYH